MCCGVAAPSSLTGYVASTATPKTKQTNKQKQKTAGTETGVEHGPALPAIVCDVIIGGDFRLVEFSSLHVLH